MSWTTRKVLREIKFQIYKKKIAGVQRPFLKKMDRCAQNFSNSRFKLCKKGVLGAGLKMSCSDASSKSNFSYLQIE